MNKVLLSALLSIFILYSHVVNAKSAEERIADLENRVTSIQQTYLTNNTDIARSISRSETIQQEFEAVKGVVETNSHLLEAQRQELQKMIRELEHRIQAIEDKMQIFQMQINNSIGKINPAAAEEGKLYQSGLDKAEKGEYLNAAADFQTFLKKYPKSTFVPTAQYWIGECFYSMKDFKRAIKEYQVFIQAYPRSEKVASALYKQGNSFYELGMVEESKPFFEKVIKEHPNSPEAAQANSKLQRIGQKGAAPAASPAPTAAGAPAAVSTPTTSTQPVGSPISSYPNETIEQQRAKYRDTLPAQNTKQAQPATQPTTPPKKEQKYYEF